MLVIDWLEAELINSNVWLVWLCFWITVIIAVNIELVWFIVWIELKLNFWYGISSFSHFSIFVLRHFDSFRSIMLFIRLLSVLFPLLEWAIMMLHDVLIIRHLKHCWPEVLMNNWRVHIEIFLGWWWRLGYFWINSLSFQWQVTAISSVKWRSVPKTTAAFESATWSMVVESSRRVFATKLAYLHVKLVVSFCENMLLPHSIQVGWVRMVWKERRTESTFSASSFDSWKNSCVILVSMRVLALVVEVSHLVWGRTINRCSHAFSTWFIWWAAAAWWRVLRACLVFFELFSWMSKMVLDPTLFTHLSCCILEHSELRLTFDWVEAVTKLTGLLAVAMLHLLWSECWWNDLLALYCLLTEFAG